MSKFLTLIAVLAFISTSCSNRKNSPARPKAVAPETSQQQNNETAANTAQPVKDTAAPSTPAAPAKDPAAPAETPGSALNSYTLSDTELKGNYEVAKSCAELINAEEQGIPLFILDGKKENLSAELYPVSMRRSHGINPMPAEEIAEIAMARDVVETKYILVRTAQTPRRMIKIKANAFRIFEKKVKKSKNECVETRSAEVRWDIEDDTFKLNLRRASKLASNDYQCFLLTVKQKKFDSKKISFKFQEIPKQGEAEQNKTRRGLLNEDKVKVKATKANKKAAKENRKNDDLEVENNDEAAVDIETEE